MRAKSVHFVGIGGVGMGSLAVALSESGYEVSGSDRNVYEPMKSVLERASVRLVEGFDPFRPKQLSPDLVVIGNVVSKDNPEAMAWVQSGKPFVSFPEAVRHFLIEDKKSIVVAGTHGKTTTVNWIAYLLEKLDQKPSYLMGGVPRDLQWGCRLTGGEFFVGEGDEYDSAFFDKGPKFLHYNPDFLVLTSIEFDHADIYRDLDHVKSSFEKLVALLPGDGLCVARYDDPVVMEVVTLSLCPVQTFGSGPGAMWRLGGVEENENGFVFEVIYKNKNIASFRTPLYGEHNLLNLLSGIAVAANLGISPEKVRPLTESFYGARRRQEVLMKEPILLIDDFAHHPTEVRATLTSVRRRHPDRRLWALFEPRSATARSNVHQEEYTKAFECADEILLGHPFRFGELKEEQRLSTDELARALNTRGKKAGAFKSVDDILAHLLNHYAPGDAVVAMSNGEFGGVQERIVAALGIKE